jgi:hypothetical protein
MVAKITTRRNLSVTLMMRVRYSTSITMNTDAVASTACRTMPL